MSKFFSVLFTFVLLTLIAATGFLANEVTGLKDQLRVQINAKAIDQLDSDQVTQKIEVLGANLKTQEDALKEFSLTLYDINKKLQDQEVGRAAFMKAPEFSVEKPLYQIENEKAGIVSVLGDSKGIKNWMSRNELFLEHVTKKSLPLVYDGRYKAVRVEGVIASSPFHQMGLRDGDRILSVNGKRLNQGQALREELLTLKNTQVQIIRNNQRKTLNVSYVDKLVQNDPAIVLGVSKAQFDDALPELLKTLKVTPVLKDGDVLGVKITELNDKNVFSLMKLQDYDIITKVDGKPVTDAKLQTALKDAAGPIEINYIREDKPESVLVKFNQN